MASTRTHNTPGNYCLQQREYSEARHYTTFKHSAYGEAVDTKLPGNGLNPAQIPWNKLSKNSADIESFLFGINSTNLVKPQGPLTPELTCLPSANIYENAPVFLPEAFVHLKNQRPNLY
jgi:hypothetical protein